MKLNILLSGLLLICVSTANLNATVYTNETVDTQCSRLEGGNGDCNMSHNCALRGNCDYKIEEDPANKGLYILYDACSRLKGGEGDCNISFKCNEENANCDIKVVASPDTKKLITKNY